MEYQNIELSQSPNFKLNNPKQNLDIDQRSSSNPISAASRSLSLNSQNAY